MYETMLMSNDAPNAMIHAVSVVPMLAPMMTEMACASVSSPALTNETVITVVAVDDCTDAVTSVPVSMPVKRLVVIAPSTWRNCGPAIFCRASLMDFIPNMRSASEPSSLNSINIEKMFVRSNSLQKYKKNLKGEVFYCYFFVFYYDKFRLSYRKRGNSGVLSAFSSEKFACSSFSCYICIVKEKMTLDKDMTGKTRQEKWLRR